LIGSHSLRFCFSNSSRVYANARLRPPARSPVTA
jgi:hypothetical protein